MNTENLLKLSTHLHKLTSAVQFDMNNYCENDGGETMQPNETHCGTVACALGCAPAIIPPEEFEEWCEYCERVFGMKHHTPEFNWCFSSQWQGIDNTSFGAALRISYLVRNGLPDSFDGEDITQNLRGLYRVD